MHLIWHRVLIAIAVVLSATVASNLHAEESGLDVFELLADEWADNKDYACNSNPHVISFSEDRTVATFSYQHPPDRSHWSPSLHTYRLSPEDSVEKVISFRVVDHGRNWLALKRVGEATSAKDAAYMKWKITLSKGDAGYSWHLYGAEAGNRSLLRGVRCKPEDKIVAEKSDIIAEANLDVVLAQLLGKWEAPGRIMGRPVVYRAEGKAVLQGSFVRIELRDLSVPARYEAIILIGKSDDNESYVAHWLDVFGPDASTIVGFGEYKSNELTLRFEQAESTVVNTFRFHRSLPLRVGRFDLVTLSIDRATQAVSETASYEFKLTRSD